MKEKRVRIFLLHRRVLAVLCTLAVAAGIFYVTLYPASRTARPPSGSCLSIRWSGRRSCAASPSTPRGATRIPSI